ncbi:hypothetical protein NC653_037780 [Populus alba x Populus x berolinensis]|uniref:RRM domain-containing protein n=1 Tax=Populus alba x Populus x berolinensis TaxID=444605 RepID=A0AAD6LGP0_9ROSI|nr:hypothetical protein NC653_037780 [Populus alba x Populus x berolinensis]
MWQVPMASSMLNSYSLHVFIKAFRWRGLHGQLMINPLRNACSGFGEVTDGMFCTCKLNQLFSKRGTPGRVSWIWFVSYESTESASEALSAMDGQELGGRNIRALGVTPTDNDDTTHKPYNNNLRLGIQIIRSG